MAKLSKDESHVAQRFIVVIVIAVVVFYILHQAPLPSDRPTLIYQGIIGLIIFALPVCALIESIWKGKIQLLGRSGGVVIQRQEPIKFRFVQILHLVTAAGILWLQLKYVEALWR